MSLPPSPRLIERLRGIGRTSIDLDSQVLIEDDNLVILAGKSPWFREETGITIQAEIGASRPAPSRNSSLTSPAAEEECRTAPSSACATDELPATPSGHEVRLEY